MNLCMINNYVHRASNAAYYTWDRAGNDVFGMSSKSMIEDKTIHLVET